MTSHPALYYEPMNLTEFTTGGLLTRAGTARRQARRDPGPSPKARGGSTNLPTS